MDPTPGHAYLVTLSHGMDDMPMRLLNDRDEAFTFARSLPWQPTRTYLKRLHLPDVSTPCCICVITFRDGAPIKREIVREYESELEAGEPTDAILPAGYDFADNSTYASRERKRRQRDARNGINDKRGR